MHWFNLQTAKIAAPEPGATNGLMGCWCYKQRLSVLHPMLDHEKNTFFKKDTVFILFPVSQQYYKKYRLSIYTLAHSCMSSPLQILYHICTFIIINVPTLTLPYHAQHAIVYAMKFGKCIINTSILTALKWCHCPDSSKCFAHSPLPLQPWQLSIFSLLPPQFISQNVTYLKFSSMYLFQLDSLHQ